MMMMVMRMMTFPMENDKSLRTVHCGIGAAGARENFGCQLQAGNDNLLIKDGNHHGEMKTYHQGEEDDGDDGDDVDGDDGLSLSSIFSLL